MNCFKSLAKRLHGIFYPPRFTCELCGREVFEGERFCASCLPTVTFNDGTTCPVCGRKTNLPEICPECKAIPPSYDKAASAIIYADGGQKLVQRFKYGNGYLKDYLAELLKNKMTDLPEADGICCVPVTKKVLHQRGYNQARLLASALSRNTGIPLIDKAVVKVKPSAPQKSLTREERIKNLKGCFRADKNLVKGKRLIVVDDIMTTGATADMVCTELKKRGATATYFLTVASVEYNYNPKN